MKIDKAPAPLIVPNPEDPRLTERVAGTDQTGAAVEIRVPVEPVSYTHLTLPTNREV